MTRRWYERIPVLGERWYARRVNRELLRRMEVEALVVLAQAEVRFFVCMDKVREYEQRYFEERMAIHRAACGLSEKN